MSSHRSLRCSGAVDGRLASTVNAVKEPDEGAIKTSAFMPPRPSTLPATQTAGRPFDAARRPGPALAACSPRPFACGLPPAGCKEAGGGPARREKTEWPQVPLQGSRPCGALRALRSGLEAPGIRVCRFERAGKVVIVCGTITESRRKKLRPPLLSTPARTHRAGETRQPAAKMTPTE